VIGMGKTRLAIEDRALEHRLRSLPPDVLRRLTLAVCRYALAHTALEEVELVDALRPNLDPAERNTYRERAAKITNELDEVGYRLSDLAGTDPHGPAHYERAFRRARAAGAVVFSLEEDPLRAAVESIYEARHAVDHPEALSQLIKAELDAHRPET
jgi:hypothetical protein